MRSVLTSHSFCMLLFILVYAFSSIQADDGFLETSVNMHVKSPSLNLPPTEFRLKKDFSKAENILEVLLNVTRSANTKARNIQHI